jgi:muramoyltetrapeptide carboxypeptidase
MKPLKPNAVIDIIAPAGKIHLPADFSLIESTLQSWGYQARFGEYLLGNHPFLSNTTELRFEDLKNALYSEDSEAIWCYRGGSGCSELLPLLDKLSPPPISKLFLGFSDITSLLVYFTQQWGWTTFHGPGAKQIINDVIDAESLIKVQQLFKGELSPLPPLISLNKFQDKISGELIGGNLSVIIHSLGTPYQIKTEHKILLLEDINESTYKIRRMLTHLTQANIFKNIKALIFGEFIHPEIDLINQELQEFANKQSFPVYKTNFIGHGKTNYWVPFGERISLNS